MGFARYDKLRPDANCNKYFNADGYLHGYAGADCDRNCDEYKYADSHADAYGHEYSDCYAHNYFNQYTDANIDQHTALPDGPLRPIEPSGNEWNEFAGFRDRK